MAKVYCEKQTTGLILPRMPKEQFIARMEETIVLRKLVLEFYNKVYLPTLRDFDGKVLNARFIKEICRQETLCAVQLQQDKRGYLRTALWHSL